MKEQKFNYCSKKYLTFEESEKNENKPYQFKINDKAAKVTLSLIAAVFAVALVSVAPQTMPDYSINLLSQQSSNIV